MAMAKVLRVHGATNGDASLGEGRCHPAASVVSLEPRVRQGAMDHGLPGRVHSSSPLQEPERRQSGVISTILGQIINIDIFLRRRHSRDYAS